MLTELKVHYDKENTRQIVFILSPLIIIVGAFWLYYINFSSIILSFIVKPFLILMIALFFTGFLHGIYLLNTDMVALILNKDGIWFDRFRFVPWNNIDDVLTYQTLTTPVQSLEIRFKDLSIVRRQATLSGKLEIFWSKLFGYPITVANIDVDNQVIIAYAKRFIS